MPFRTTFFFFYIPVLGCVFFPYTFFLLFVHSLWALHKSVKLFLCISIIMKSTPISNIHMCLIHLYMCSTLIFLYSLHHSVRASPERMKNRYTCRTWWHRFVNVKPLYMKTNVYLSYNTLVRLFMVSFTFLHFTLYLLLFSFENLRQ